jgi:alpha-mannosidase
VRYWVVPHTHWDREWYLPFEQLRLHLARVLDGVVEALEEDPSFHRFTLDGQAVVLEDYLEVRPEQAERLRRLIADGRVAIGPWYTLPDEYLAGQESLVRNLLHGRRVCEQFGKPMAVGYLPDTFGHVAQLPQLLCGFGLDTFVFWRGLGDEAERLGSAFRWRGPDGSEVLAVRELGGYGNADRLGGGDPEAAAVRVRELTGRFGALYARCGLDDFLLSNGNDHRPIQRGLPALLDACAERLPGASFRIATIEEYADAVRTAARHLEQVEGELCGGDEIAVLRGVNSSRVYLKQANEAAERELFVAEVLASLAHLRGHPYPAGELRLAWRKLLKNHAHDSICGCSADETHRDMAPRFEAARSIAGGVRRSALAALAGGEPPWWPSEPPRAELSVVNVLPWPRPGTVELALPPALARRRRLAADVDGRPVPVQVERGRALVVLEVPGLRARRLRVGPGPGTRPEGAARAVSERAIENGFYRVEAAPNGTLAVTELATGEVVEGLNLLEDQADRGDEYNFCALEGETPWTGRDLRARVDVTLQGPVAAELELTLSPRLPHSLAPGRQTRTRETVICPVRTIVRLTAGVDRVELRTTVVNRARDHRLRVLFPAPGAGETVRVEGHFAVLRRPLQPSWNGHWSEPPQTTHHTLGMVAAGRLALFTRGLPEYEALPRPDGSVELALTLLRCVGWLSRDDLASRFHHAGPAIETPEAQCLGTHAFEYALSLRGEQPDCELVRAAHDYRLGLVSGPPGIDLDGLLELEGTGFALAALKGGEDGDGVILRVYNPTGEQTGVGVRSHARTARCRLDETDCRPARERIGLRPYEVATLRLR